MRIKTLLTTLCLFCGLSTINGQQATNNRQQPEEDSQVYYAPPRKEIRHILKNHPKDNELQLAATRASGEYIMTEFPTRGEIKGVVILAAFDDVPFSTDTIGKLLNKRYNADNYSEDINFKEYSSVYDQELPLQCAIPGSARDYFRTQSFGQFVPTFDIIGPIKLDSIRSYYGANNSSGNDKNTSGMIREVCQKAYDLGLTDFTDYDNNGDGVVDFVYVVYSGSDEAQTGITEAIWAKASTISLTLGNKMKISRYACSGELVIDLPVVAGIGTFVHEFSHVLGLPDFYNTLEDDFTMDSWSVMDYGMYNAEGFVPCNYTAFERYSLGWLPMYTLDAPSTMNLGTSDEEKRGYRIFTSEADTTSFYLLETIRREGWNRYAPANGLLISEVTYDRSAWRSNTINNGTYHRHCIVPADNNYSYKTANKHLFGTKNHEFSLNSVPSSRTQFGAAMNKPLTDIYYDETEGVTRFHFCGGGESVGVDETITDNSISTTYHDLLGRSVSHPTKGIYIVNGKKVIIK